MLVEEKLYISPNYNAKHYLDIGLSLGSPDKNWRKAVAILEDRINGRYLNPIQELIRHSPNENKDNNVITNGFAAMALMCLLIETFMQFRNGDTGTPSLLTKNNYIRFMQECLGYDRNLANIFYSDIRCGILHSAETKNGSFLIPKKTIKTIDVKTEKGKTTIGVSIPKMLNDLKLYFHKYCNELLDSQNTKCRENFIKKMNSLTTKHGNTKLHTIPRSSRGQHTRPRTLTR